MLNGLIVLFILQSQQIPAYYTLLRDIIESQTIKLSQKPELGKEVTAVYEVTPKTSRKDLKVVFYEFEGVRPISKDTIFEFHAKQGKTRRFKIMLQYFSTPATFRVKVSGTNIWGKPVLTLNRYLFNVKSGEYGSIKEIQLNPPLEYRFNPKLKKFEQQVFNFEKDRWQKNRAMIDTIKNVAPKVSDSLCLLLYVDLFKVIYPREIVGTAEKAKYLLRQGWKKFINEADREEFLMELKRENEIRNEEKLKRLEREAQIAQNIRTVKWLLSWLIPTILLGFLLIGLLAVRARRQNKVVRLTRFDKKITYIIYVIVIGIAGYFAWPYLGVKIQTSKSLPIKHLMQKRKVLYEIRHSNLLSDFNSFKLVSASTFGTRLGLGANFVYQDEKHSKYNVEYYFTVQIWPTTEGFQVRQPIYSPVKAIINFEENKRVSAFLSKNSIKKARLNFIDSLFSVTIKETITQNNIEITLLLEYDGKKDLITKYVVPADFDDDQFPEIRVLSKKCESWGHRIKKDTYIEGVHRSHGGPPRLKTLVENSGNDTLRIRFYSEKYDRYTYTWIPVPETVEPHESIIDQIYSEFSKAGLPIEYAKKYIRAISSRAFRRPNYFSHNEKDRVIVEATFKWITGADWVDNMNNNEGARFTVVYEYFSNSLKLGRTLGKPETKGIQRVWKQTAPRYYRLRPIKRIISNKEARKRLFETLPDGVGFNAIYVKLNIPIAPADCNNFICLVGNYTPQGANYSFDVMVDLETGEILETQLSRGWHWTECEIPQMHSYPYD